MALRKLCYRLRPFFGPGTVRWAGTAPSVFDKVINVTIIDRQGLHHTLRGLEGQTLVEVLAANLDTLGDEVVVRSPEGRGAIEAHVKVPNELVFRIPVPRGDDARSLAEVVDSVSFDPQHSRLASKIVLDRSMKGALVALGGHCPWKTL